MTTGERIKTARTKRGLTQKELGAALGLSYQTIAQWETGKRKPKLATLQKIAIALNVPLDELLGGIEVFDTPEELEQRMKEVDEALRKRPHPDTLTIKFRGGSPKARLESAWNRLNDEGQEAAASRVEEVAEVPKYQKTEK